MSLTLGTGPFARPRRGALNFDLDAAAPPHVLYLHEVPQRVRGELAGETVVDTMRAGLLHETGLLPVWYLPREDVRADLHQPTDRHTSCPFKGDASYYTVRVGDRVEENAAWAYPDPLPGAPPLANLVAFYFDRLDAWYEEDERVLGHPRDPFHRIDTRRSSRHVVIRVGGETVADSRRPVALFETGLPPRFYLPPEDVRADLLTPSDTTTICPYKGVASYVDAVTSGAAVHDVAWIYPDPLGEALAVRDHLSFYPDRADIRVEDAPHPS